MKEKIKLILIGMALTGGLIEFFSGNYSIPLMTSVIAMIVLMLATIFWGDEA